MTRALAVLFCAAACAPAPAAVRPPRAEPDGPMPEINEQTVLYDVDGRTSAELRNSLDQHGPTDEAGRHDALTKWFVRWFYDYAPSDGACGLTNVRATLEVTFTLPRWPIETPELRERWQRYLKHLRAHERGHMQNGIDAARVIVSRIERLPPGADCDRAGAAANALGDAELELARARDRAYDDETQHGATQGATFR